MTSKNGINQFYRSLLKNGHINQLIKITTKNLQKQFGLKKNFLTTCLNIAAKEIGYDKDATINILFSNDLVISHFHQEYLNDPTVTDVITFPMEEIDPETNQYLLGDLIISWETAEREAKKRNISTQMELILYAIHGFLHLNGYDDKSEKDKKKMNQLQNKILKKIYQ